MSIPAPKSLLHSRRRFYVRPEGTVPTGTRSPQAPSPPPVRKSLARETWLRIDPPEITTGDRVVAAIPEPAPIVKFCTASAFTRTPTPEPPSPLRTIEAFENVAAPTPPTGKHEEAQFVEPTLVQPTLAETENAIPFVEFVDPDREPTHDPHKWLALHATDLIERLTEWSEDLGERESNLNAREAKWERQARRLRMQFQETQMELDDITADLERRTRQLKEQQLRMHRDVRTMAMVM
ncbi:hypothetical protein [Neorhodopirellula lusitana]|uniref:hypothetical protein n=1 Tax=Neorhodopirellula lusitana TaxID=445327 RepID=UPI00384DA69F